MALIPEGAAGKYDPADYAPLLIPHSWRIIATMNVFDKSLLFEMSFALMRRFAFIEVPSPPAGVFAKLWERELEDMPPEWAEETDGVLHGLLALRSTKDIGPAVFLDMARFARQYIDGNMQGSAQELAFQLFYSYLLPQFEGITNPQAVELFRKVRPLVGAANRDRLRGILIEVLGVVLPTAQSADNVADLHEGDDDGLDADVDAE
jgi:hypothetical protein